MLRTDSLAYELPEGLIATEPASPRDAARLMVVDRASGEVIEHTRVRELTRFVRTGDAMVMNRSAVLPARFVGVREETGGGVQGLYVGGWEEEDGEGWKVMLKMRRHRVGARVRLRDRTGAMSTIELEIVGRDEGNEDDGGVWRVRVYEDGELCARSALSVLSGSDGEKKGGEGGRGGVGFAALPPYILAARKAAGQEADAAGDVERYQTVYAERALSGSVAAPTAGLHFTDELLSRLDAQGVRRGGVVLHVGLGTFKPIEAEHVQEHPIHNEWCSVPMQTAELIEQTRREGGRVVAVGTTTARTLESFAGIEQMRQRGPGGMETDILIAPGHAWRHVDALMTNFHLPRSTLLAMVGAFVQPSGEAEPMVGIDRLKRLYEIAVREKYRFYSYGDAMLIV